MRRLLWLWGMLCCCWCPLALAAPTPAAKAAQSRELAKEADRLYSANRYLEAAQVLKEAYAGDPNPILLYNLARAYDQAGELDVAQENYLKFVGQRDAPADLVKKANLALDRLRGLLARREADRRVADAEKKRLTSDAQQAQERADAEAQKSRSQRESFEARERKAQDEAGQKSSSRKIAALVTGGTAVAAAAVGLGFGLSANGSKRAFDSANTVQDKRSLESATRTQALVADLSLVVAVGAALTAVLLYPKGEAVAPGLAMSVGPVPGGGAVAAFGASF